MVTLAGWLVCDCGHSSHLLHGFARVGTTWHSLTDPRATVTIVMVLKYLFAYFVQGSAMQLAGRIFRWTEHIVLIVLLLVLLSIIAPFGSKATGKIASVTTPVSADASIVDESGLADELVDLLPDVGAIYRTAVAYPLQKARGDITDPELLEFYDGYLQAIGFAPEP